MTFLFYIGMIGCVYYVVIAFIFYRQEIAGLFTGKKMNGGLGSSESNFDTGFNTSGGVRKGVGGSKNYGDDTSIGELNRHRYDEEIKKNG